MFARLCKNSIFPTPTNTVGTDVNPSNGPSSSSRNDYRVSITSASVSTPSSPVNNRQLPTVPYQRRECPPFRREPPPSYWAHYNPFPQQSQQLLIQQQLRATPPRIPNRRPTNHQIPHRSRVEQHRNRIPPSDSESDNERGRQAARGRTQRRNSNGLKNECLLDEDLFCPDLVRNCKSIRTTPDDDDNQDYIEIEDLSSSTSQLKLSQHNELGLPTVEYDPVNKATVMGQSLRRPKISLTWVLRDLSETQEQPKNVITVERIIHKKKKQHSPQERLFNEKYVSENNLTEFRGNKTTDVISTAPKESLIKTPVSNAPPSTNLNFVRKKSGKFKKNKLNENCCNNGGLRTSPNDNHYDTTKFEKKGLSQSQVNLASKNSVYSEPSLYMSAQSDSGALVKRHRRRRRYRSPKFGYEIKNVDDFLSRCSLTNPANIPVVLSTSSILYQTRTGYQMEVPLPLGMVVNSVFKNQSWLYVQTPHGEEGYVSFNACLPLGILPNQRSQSTSKPTPCWESNGDIFPRPCGNLTDSEKEIQLRGGTRSEGRRTPKLKRNNRSCSEKQLDSLYLRAASQPKVIDQSYAQLKPTNKCKLSNYSNTNGDYVQLKQQNVEQEKIKDTKININATTKSIRQTLLAITENYSSDTLQVKKGDVVTLLACKEYQEKDSGNFCQWFYIKNQSNQESWIPTNIADEFL